MVDTTRSDRGGGAGTLRSERRQHPRTALYSAARVLREDRAASLLWVEDLSLGGARLFGRESLAVGEVLRLLIHLPWYRPLTVEARVVWQHRTSRNKHHVAVSFVAPTAAVQFEIGQAIAQVGRCPREREAPRALMLTDDPRMLCAMERHLYRAATPWVLAQTPLEAVEWLQDREVKIDTVFVDLAFERFNVLTLLSFLHEEYAGLKRILLTGDAPTTLEKVATSCGKTHAVLRIPAEQREIDALFN